MGKRFKRKIVEIKGGGSVALEEIGLAGKGIQQLWTVYDEDKMWSVQLFDPFTGKRIVKGEQASLESLILLHEQGVWCEDIVHDWRVRSDGRLHYYSRYVREGKTTKILIEYEG